MRDNPVIAYSGELRGFAATKPTLGHRIDKSDPNVTRYAEHLRSQHDAALRKVGGKRKLYSYSNALNGFAAELTTDQVRTMRAIPGVVLVARNQIYTADTMTTPAYLGLDGPNGVWEGVGGGPQAGQDIVVGVLDSGIWPENPSFADRTPGDNPLPGWQGECVPGEEFPASLCNDKLIGARWYSEGFGGDDEINQGLPEEYISARAYAGHGVHTASTAVGNYRTPVNVKLPKPARVSGVAPGARLAVYKVCWGLGGCSSVDIMAAVDDAVADGVDVINMSLGSPPTKSFAPLDLALLFAADAGVFIAQAGGNSGANGAGTVSNDSPWTMTVAAGTHDRLYQATVRLGNGASYKGGSVSDAVPSSPLVLAASAGIPSSDPGAPPEPFHICAPEFKYDPAKISGKIVVCDSGVPISVQSEVVASYGGVGMISVSDIDFIRTSFAVVPSVSVDRETGAAIKAYVSSVGQPTARISAAVATIGTPAPAVASFSSRGPSLASGGDLLKPDILAPGVNVLAAYSPVDGGRNFEFLSGTSMASPHIAGIAALIKQRHPAWSPAAIKSALMTSATVRRNDGAPINEYATNSLAAGPFGMGAGQVNPSGALDPGLVYDAGLRDWMAYLCGAQQVCFVPGLKIDPSNLNYPSIAIGALAGTQTVQRTVTNVGQNRSKYTVSIESPPGVDVTVTPSSFTLKPGAKQTYQVKLRSVSAGVNVYSAGALTWSDGTHKVRSPIVVRPVALEVPAEVSSKGAAVSFPIGFQYFGAFTASVRGLVPASVQEGAIDDASPGWAAVIEVPTGTTHLRLALFDEETQGNANLDMFVFGLNFEDLHLSTGLTSTEALDFPNPRASTEPGFGSYLVFVQPGPGSPTTGLSSKFKLNVWTVGSTTPGNVTIKAPTEAAPEGPGTVNLSFTGLVPGTRYLGSVAYAGSGSAVGEIGMPAPTLVRVNP